MSISFDLKIRPPGSLDWALNKNNGFAMAIVRNSIGTKLMIRYTKDVIAQ